MEFKEGRSSDEFIADGGDASAAPAGWRYSLRSLLLLTLVCAVLGGIYRLFGMAAFWPSTFSLASILLAVKLRGPGKQAYMLAWSATYGPFLTMATYALTLVSCTHCKLAAWQVLPLAPAILPLEIARWLFDLPRPEEYYLGIAIGFAVSAAMTWGLALFVRRRSCWVQRFVILTVLALNSLTAYALMKAIQA